MKLNLGAADRHVEGYICVDIAPVACPACDALHPSMNRYVDLAMPWPWADNSLDEILALDVCEHIGSNCRMIWVDVPHGTPGLFPPNGRIHFLNELHRVLRPGGKARVETPNAAHGVGFFQDPTHVSPYCLSTFRYFEHKAFAHSRLAAAYGITAAFRIISLTESRSNGENPAEEVWKIKAIMEAVK